MRNRAEKHTSPLLNKLMAERDPDETVRTRTRMLLAAKIDDALKAKGWKKKDLVVALGKKPSVITKWLSGTHNFTSDTLTDIGRVLNINLLNTEERPKEIIERFVPVIITQTPAETFAEEMDPSYGQLLFEGNAKSKTQSITFQIKNIEIAESELNLPNINKPKPVSFQFNINIEHRFIIEKQLVIVYVDIQISDDEYKLGSIKTACVFEIQDFEEYLNADKTAAKLPEDNIVLLNSIAISTSRGVMYAHFRGTHLHNAILPIINPKDLKKENL